MKKNIAFIDGQNLQMGTTKCSICAKSKNIPLGKMMLEDCICGSA